MKNLYRIVSVVLFLCLLSCDNSLSLGGGKNESPEDNREIIKTDSHDVNTVSSRDPLSDLVFCSGTMSVDGPGGFLWKPESEADGNLAILFPAEFTERFLDVLAIRNDGDQESGAFAGFTNGDRQTWRFDLPGEEYAGLIEVDAGNQTCEWIVPNPEERQD